MLTFRERKKIRARVIKEYITRSGYDRAVCFSCGNASQALKEEGLEVVEIAPGGDLQSSKWWHPEEIQSVWPGCFDATAGHLPLPLMQRLGREYRLHLEKTEWKRGHPEEVRLATGSGETLIALKMAVPDVEFIAVYDLGPGTAYEPENPLNIVVENMAKDIQCSLGGI